MKRALRFFGNRLGNCAYDKIFLKDVKNVRPNASSIPFRPANYPKSIPPDSELKQTSTITPSTSTTIQQNQHNQPYQVSNLQSAPASNVPQIQLNQKPVPVASPVIDENMFDNSMMISEEDLIASDENYGVFVELEASFQREGIYPILPNKRK